MNDYLDFKCSEWFLKSKNTYLIAASQWFLFTKLMNQCFLVSWFRDTPFCCISILNSLISPSRVSAIDFAMNWPNNSSSITNVDSFGSSYDWIRFYIKAFWFVIHSSTSLLLTFFLFFLNWETLLKFILEEVSFTVILSSKTFKESKMAKLVFWCQPFHCCCLFSHPCTDFSTDSNKTLD